MRRIRLSLHAMPKWKSTTTCGTVCCRRFPKESRVVNAENLCVSSMIRRCRKDCWNRFFLPYVWINWIQSWPEADIITIKIWWSSLIVGGKIWNIRYGHRSWKRNCPERKVFSSWFGRKTVSFMCPIIVLTRMYGCCRKRPWARKWKASRQRSIVWLKIPRSLKPWSGRPGMVKR